MEIEVLDTMSDKKAYLAKNRLEILDRLINTQVEKGNNLFSKAWEIEKRIILDDPEFKSIIKERLAKFIEMNKLYKH